MKMKINLIAALLCLAGYCYGQQPFEKFGYETKIATLSDGKFEEFFDMDSVAQIGTVVINRFTGKILSFVEYDTLYSEATLEPQIISKWLSPDPLADEYHSFSPYNFVLNNPIIYVDPDGQKVKPASKSAFNVLLNTLDPTSRQHVSLNDDGFVEISGAGSGSNFESLQQLVNDDRTTEFALAESFDFKNSDGKIEKGSLGGIDNSSELDVMFEAYGGNVSKEQLAKQGFSDKKEDSGIFGITLLPGGENDPKGDGRGSANGNIIVLINSGLTDRNKSGTAAHEGFGHALFFVLGKNPNHGEDRNNDNQELENQIRNAVNEAFGNFDKNKK